MKSSIFLLLFAAYSNASVLSDTIGRLESNNNYQAINRFGYLGKYQFGGMALIDLGYKNKDGWTNKDGIESKEDFLNDKEVQERAFTDWVSILEKYLKRNGSLEYIGKKINNIKITKNGLLAASHLVGASAVSKMLKTGIIPKDGNGTKATKYLKEFEEK